MKKTLAPIRISLIYNSILIAVIVVGLLINKYAGFAAAVFFASAAISYILISLLFIIIWYMLREKH